MLTFSLPLASGARKMPEESFESDEEFEPYAEETVPVTADAEGFIMDISGQVHASIQEATAKLRKDLLAATGLVAGDPAPERMRKVWDSMDSIGDTTSCMIFWAMYFCGANVVRISKCVRAHFI